MHPVDDLHAEIVRFVKLLKSTLCSAAVADQSSLLLLWPLLHEGPMRLRELATSKGVDSSTASRQAAQLVKAGLIRREPDPEDGRAALLDVTEHGRLVCQRVLDARRTAIETALRDWEPSRIAALAELLRDFNAAMAASPTPQTSPTPAPTQETS